MLVAAIATAALLGGGLLGLWLYHRDVEQSRRSLARGPDGIILGAASIDLPRPDAPAVLLLHGAGDTPQTLRGLAHHLHGRGYHVCAPLLPGHGRAIEEFSHVSAVQLLAAARE